MSGGDLCEYCQYSIFHACEEIEEFLSENSDLDTEFTNILNNILPKLNKYAETIKLIDLYVSADIGKEECLNRLSQLK